MVWVFRSYLAFAALAGALLLIGVFLPASARVERSLYVERPPATLYALAARPATFPDWSPKPRDGASPVRYEFEGPESGVGAQAFWTRGGQAARFQIMQAEPYALVESRVDEPGRGALRMTVSITPHEDGTFVNWRAETGFGLNVIKRYAGLGWGGRMAPDLEQGLERLRALALSVPEGDFASAELERVRMRSVPVAYVERTVRGGLNDQEAAFSQALVDVRRFLRDQRAREIGPVYSVTLDWTPPVWRFQAALPYEGVIARGEGDVLLGQSPDSAAVKATHRGDSQLTPAVYDQLNAYIGAHRLQPAGPVWEAWVTDRGQTPPQEQITEIFVPIEGGRP